MRSDATIEVYCDECERCEVVPLTATARGYDERDVNRHLESLGWKVGDEDICDQCSSESESPSHE